MSADQIIDFEGFGRSWRRRGKIERVYIGAALRDLGPRGAAESLAAACRVDAEELERISCPEGAALLREAAAVYEVTRRRLVTMTSRGWSLAFSGKLPVRHDAADEYEVLESMRVNQPGAWAVGVLQSNMKDAA